MVRGKLLRRGWEDVYRVSLRLRRIRGSSRGPLALIQGRITPEAIAFAMASCLLAALNLRKRHVKAVFLGGR